MRERKVLSAGSDHTEMFSTFRALIEKAGAVKGDSLIWAGCEGACYAMATFFGYDLENLGISQYFATDADMNRIRRLDKVKDIGMVASRKEDPLAVKVIVLMSGLARVPFENVLTLVRERLSPGGVIIGETVVPGLFEDLGWCDSIPMSYVFEFSMLRPTAFEILETV